MTGTQLSTFCDEVNSGASIRDTLKQQFLNLAEALIEQRGRGSYAATPTLRYPMAANT
jgi:hypothetical protein